MSKRRTRQYTFMSPGEDAGRDGEFKERKKQRDAFARPDAAKLRELLLTLPIRDLTPDFRLWCAEQALPPEQTAALDYAEFRDRFIDSAVVALRMGVSLAWIGLPNNRATGSDTTQQLNALVEVYNSGIAFLKALSECDDESAGLLGSKLARKSPPRRSLTARDLESPAFRIQVGAHRKALVRAGMETAASETAALVRFGFLQGQRSSQPLDADELSGAIWALLKGVHESMLDLEQRPRSAPGKKNGAAKPLYEALAVTALQVFDDVTGHKRAAQRGRAFVDFLDGLYEIFHLPKDKSTAAGYAKKAGRATRHKTDHI